MQKPVVFGCLSVMGGMLIQLSYGYFYTIGNMGPYMIDYMNFYNRTISQNAIVWLTSVQISVEAIAMPLGAWMHRKFPIRAVTAVGCSVHSCGILLTYFTLKSGYVGVLFTYGVLQGFGMGFGYSVTISAAALWFPKNRGLVVGLIVAGFGAGALVFTPIQTGFINPENIKFDNTTQRLTDRALLDRVPTSFLVMAGITAFIELIGILILNDKPKEGEIAHRPATSEYCIAEEEGTVLSKSIEVTPMQALHTMDFYLLWASLGLSVVPVISLSSLHKFVGRSFLNDDLFLAGVGMSASVCNTVGRVMWGMLCDRISFKAPMCFMLGLWAILICVFPHLDILSGMTAKVIYVIWVSVMFICISGVFVLAPAATNILFGSTNMGVNYGLVYTAFILGSVLAALISSIPINGNWKYFFAAISLTCVAALVSVLWIADVNAPRSLQFINFPVKLRTICGRRRGCSHTADLKTPI